MPRHIASSASVEKNPRRSRPHLRRVPSGTRPMPEQGSHQRLQDTRSARTEPYTAPHKEEAIRTVQDKMKHFSPREVTEFEDKFNSNWPQSDAVDQAEFKEQKLSAAVRNEKRMRGVDLDAWSMRRRRSEGVHARYGWLTETTQTCGVVI